MFLFLDMLSATSITIFDMGRHIYSWFVFALDSYEGTASANTCQV